MPTLLHLSRELAALAQAGLTYAADHYNTDRYARIHAIASEILQIAKPLPDFRWPLERGYPTPKVDVRGLVFRDDQILLVKETASGKWTAPGGFAEVNVSPAENVEKEVREESGYLVKARQLTSVVDKERAGYLPDTLSIYKLYFLCDLLGGSPTPSTETSEVDFFPLKALPDLDLHRVSPDEIIRGHRIHQGHDHPVPYFN
ncbi:MAG TPA: NUDIX hydrolase N-terminal domain-containing protein [Chthoniobacterales bacterium]